MVDGYAAWADSYDDMENFAIAIEEPVVRAMYGPGPIPRVVDAACGTGRHLSHLVATGSEGIGVDKSEAMLQRARAKVPSADLRQGDLSAIPVHDQWADLVVCSLALTHVINLAGPLGEFNRVVKPGGRVIVSDIHPFFTALGFHGFFGDDQFVRNRMHLHSAYLQAIQAAGLEVRTCIEPAWTAEMIAAQAWTNPVAAAAQQALLGLPFILIWDLSRPLD